MRNLLVLFNFFLKVIFVLGNECRQLMDLQFLISVANYAQSIICNFSKLLFGSLAKAFALVNIERGDSLLHQQLLAVVVTIAGKSIILRAIWTIE